MHFTKTRLRYPKMFRLSEKTLLTLVRTDAVSTKASSKVKRAFVKKFPPLISMKPPRQNKTNAFG